jgi:photosystem II stability/assembly factor-like uncharacterized protein
LKTIFRILVIAILIAFTKHSAQAEWRGIKVANYDAGIGSMFFINSSTGYFGGGEGRLWKTIDGGENIVEVNSNLPTTTSIYTIKFFGNTGYAAGYNGKITKSIDGGETWTTIPSFTTKSINDMFLFSGNEILVVCDNGGIYKTVNGGLNWINISQSMTERLSAVNFNGDIGFIGASYKLGASTDRGLTWVFTNSNWRGKSTDDMSSSIYFGGDNLNEASIVSTDNNGQNWSEQSFPLVSQFTGISFFDNTGYAVGYKFNNLKDTAYAYRTTNGTTWERVDITGSEARGRFISVFSTSNSVFIGSDGGWIYKNEIQVGISGVNSEIPSGYSLSQNYPNPFNPTTKINFSIPTSGNVKLTVYNTVGKEVTVLLNQNLSVGSYTTDFDATNLTSGAYFYTLQSEKFSETKRMVLLK